MRELQPAPLVRGVATVKSVLDKAPESAPTVCAMTYLPNQYLTVEEAAERARADIGDIRQAIEIGDLRATNRSLIRTRHLDIWRRAATARITYLTIG